MRAAGRRPVPRELPAVVGMQQFARFERIDPVEHCERFYLLALQPTLLGTSLVLTQNWQSIDFCPF
jgi:hypothetical protein